MDPDSKAAEIQGENCRQVVNQPYKAWDFSRFLHHFHCSHAEVFCYCSQDVERKLERQTQTVKIAQRSAQTMREAATQMERPGVILDTTEDR